LAEVKEGYAKVKDRSRDLSVSVAEANVYSLFLVFPLVAILAGIYGAVWGYDLYAAANMSLWSYLLFMVSLALGMVAHELIHGVSWTLVGRMPLSTVELGLQWRTLTPYAHCKGSLSIQAYRIGMVMPGVLLGLLPSIVGIVNTILGLPTPSATDFCIQASNSNGGGTFHYQKTTDSIESGAC
jgi:hypothetical protein